MKQDRPHMGSIRKTASPTRERIHRSGFCRITDIKDFVSVYKVSLLYAAKFGA